MGRCSINLIASICRRHGPGDGSSWWGQPWHPTCTSLAIPSTPGLGSAGALRVPRWAEQRASPVQALGMLS